ncbi:MAG: hypothetical protein KatS3mg057_1895 [Herpetosiphonaceae bacterium]|nr:MAG: hypothetical protein KatS3mg057_1895 [Herpetosiphonaceae bacterium]
MWWLELVEDRRRNSPYTFYVPSKKVLDKLAVGDFAKLIFAFESDDPRAPSAERMWVQIERVDGNEFIGRLDNKPLYLKSIAYGEKVRFNHSHIIDTNLYDPESQDFDTYILRCLVTNRVLYDGERVGYLYREEPESENDSGWRIMAGDETDEYMDNLDHVSYVSLGAVLNRDDSFRDLLESPPGSHYCWDKQTAMFVRCD